MYVRFTVTRSDEVSRLPQGVITAAYDLSDAGMFSPDAEERFQELRLWFRRHLRVPKRFARSAHGRGAGPAVCWFKDSATAAIRRARSLAALVEEHQLPVQMILCHRAGYIVYEDEHQVVAEPFRSELPLIRRRS